MAVNLVIWKLGFWDDDHEDFNFPPYCVAVLTNEKWNIFMLLFIFGELPMNSTMT